jgi:hypothetical protein
VHRTLPVPSDPAEESSVPRRLANLFGPILRQYVGVTYSHSQGGLWLPVQIVVVAGLVGAYLVAVWRRRGLADLLRGRVDRRRPADLLLAVAPVTVVLWAASDATWYTGTPRYLAGTFPVLAIGLAALVPLRPRAAPVLAVVLCGALVWGFFVGQPRGVTAARDRDLRAVTDLLTAEGTPDVYAAYWTAMPLQYLAGDRLTVATATGLDRFPDAHAAVDRAPAAAIVGSADDGSTAAFRAALDRAGIRYRARVVGGLTVFDQLPPHTDPGRL